MTNTDSVFRWALKALPWAGELAALSLVFFA